MADNKSEKCDLKEFFYHEYKVYLDLAKLSEENRDKYIRMYLITISALIGFVCKVFSDSHIYNGFFLMLITILVLIFSLSFIMARVLFSGRNGNVRSKKRLNILRKYLAIMECKDIDVDGILLDTTINEPKYWKRNSITGTLIITVLAVMIICFVAIFLISLYSIHSLSVEFKNEMLFDYIIVFSFILLLDITVFPCLIVNVFKNICHLKERDKFYKKNEANEASEVKGEAQIKEVNKIHGEDKIEEENVDEEKQNPCLICMVIDCVCQLSKEDIKEEKKLKESIKLINLVIKKPNCYKKFGCNEKSSLDETRLPE